MSRRAQTFRQARGLAERQGRAADAGRGVRHAPHITDSQTPGARGSPVQGDFGFRLRLAGVG
ncbi:MAG: hypothetical protein OXG44_17670, partial [Gammaproteobacteria bacterium]|nr:hypothetical protein [Gammaproteobacteria bacterium]